MQLREVLDVVEALLNAVEHPDITGISRYGKDTAPGGGSPAGVAVQHSNGSQAYIWGSDHPGEVAVPMPEAPPPPKRRADRLAILVVQLLDVAKPSQFRAWRLVGFPDIGPVDEQGRSPSGVSLMCADGTKMLLRVTAGSGPIGDPVEEPAPGWRVPDNLRVDFP